MSVSAPQIKSNLERLIAGIFRAAEPPRKLSLSQWANTKAVLSAESAHEPGQWTCIPYQVGIMDAITDPLIEQVTVMKSSRVGYTKVLNNVIGYFIDQDPCSMLVVQPTIEDAAGYSKEEIAPMIRDTPCLSGKVRDVKTRSGDNTILHKMFPGGILSMVGANSARGFRRISRRVVLFDEVDGYPKSAGTEGSPIKLGIKRTEYFWNRKIVAGSTPTEKDNSNIQILFGQSDQRRYFVPCPHCKQKQALKWGGPKKPFGIKWPDGEPMRAYYECEHCHKAIEHKWLRWMVERGEWRATAPGNGRHAGFHIWSAYSYSPNATWGHIATEFLESKDDRESLKTFVNTTLGELWEEEYSAKVGAEDLEKRAENYELRSAPAEVMLATAGIDVQENRIAVSVKGWREGEESWLIDWQEISGDPERPELWAQLDNLLDTPMRHASGAEIRILAAAIDTGHHTHAVYSWVRQRTRKRNAGETKCFVIAIKGSSISGRPVLGKPTKQDVNHKNQLIKKGVDLWAVGTDTAKATIYRRLKRPDAGAGFMHFPVGLPEDYFTQLTCEKQVIRYVDGFPKKTWVKKSGARNEALDCEVYAFAALQFFYTRTNRATIWAQCAALLTKNAPAPPSSAAPAPEVEPESRPPRKSPGMARRRRGGGGWVSGG